MGLEKGIVLGKMKWKSKQNLVHQIVVLLLLFGLSRPVEGEEEGCSHPSIPSGATYSNLTGGLGDQTWRIRYSCDIGKIHQTFKDV